MNGGRMPIEILKPAQVRTILKRGVPGKHGDGAGLMLLVRGPDAASWLLRYQRNGVRREMGLGKARDLTLDDVRERARQARRQIALGNDPIAAKRKTFKHVTFRQVAEAVLRQHEGNGHVRAGTIKGLRSHLNHAYPVLGGMTVADISRADVLRVLEPLWSTKPPTARHVRARIEMVLNAAAARELRSTDNPAAWSILKPILGNGRRTENHTALDWRQIPELMKQLSELGSMPARALQFLILTAVRSDEARCAVWTEIDRDMWRIPAERTKARREHRVPLAPQALELLKRLHNIRRPPFVFFGAKDRKPINTDAMLRVLAELGLGNVTVHGMRSTFRDWCADNGEARELAEAALAHAVKGVEGDYQRSDIFDRRRRLMRKWAAFCHGA
jgi:integrase